MDYSEAVAYLDTYINYERLPNYRWTQAAFRLDRMFRMLELLGNPHAKYPCAHVAGTKGKGSTSTFIASVLRAHGKKTGLYLSPHVLDLRERVSVNGDWIGKEEFAQIMGELRPVIEQVEKEMIPATYFEILTALAMVYFARQKVDVAVFEVGIGGRLDATNVVVPVVSVITTIGFDHMDKLGDTLAAIAGEKCGIIKPRVPVVSAPQKPEAFSVIEGICGERGSPLKVVGCDIKVTVSQTGELAGTRFGIMSPGARYEVEKLGIEGVHQPDNAACAVLALKEMQKAGLVELMPEKVAGGLADAHLPARFEVIPGEPVILLDGAHNGDSLASLAESLKKRAGLAGRRKVAVVGLAGDKDLKACLSVLGEVADEFIFTRTSNPRAVAPEKLLETLATVSGRPAQVKGDIPEAFSTGLNAAGPDGLVIVTGSFYLAGDVSSIIMDARRTAEP